jgi:hypothetical protein
MAATASTDHEGDPDPMCSEGSNTGSGEGRGPSAKKVQKGWIATDRERREHSDGYGERAKPKERRWFENWFAGLVPRTLRG